MKTYSLKNLLFALSFVLIGATSFTSCKENSSSTTPKNIISEANNTSEVNSAFETEYTSKMTKADKKKYFDGSNNVVYEVKYKPDGFKLRTASSDLLWKVKIYENKVKISDNEENENPWEIKMVAATEAKLVKNETEIARSNFDAGTTQQTISFEDGTKEFSKNVAYSPSFLVTAINDIPKDQQNIIIAELKDKGY